MYRLYTLQGDYEQYSLGPDAAEVGVIDAKIYENGMVAMLSNVNLMEVKGWTGSKPLILASPGMLTENSSLDFTGCPLGVAGFTEPPPCWSLVEPDQTVSRHVEALIPNETTVYSIDSLEAVDQVGPGKCDMAPLPDLTSETL